VETNNVLSNHKFDITMVKKPDQKHHNKSKPKEEKDEEEATPLSFAQMEGKCYCCGKPGHKSPECRSKEKISREEWAINKSQQQHVQAKSDDAKSTGGSTITRNKEAVVGWTGLQCSFAQTVDIKELILLDSDSTDTVFCKPKYVMNIRGLNYPLSISTNGGELKSYKKCDIPHIDNVRYNKNSITNIISMKDMTDKFRVMMDSKEELALLVHMPDKIVKFKQFSNGLYAMDPNNKTSFEMKKKPYQFLTTVKDNMKFLSKRQQEQAKKARELLEVMGIPTVDNLKAMIRMNLIKNNVVTTEDVNLATKAYGPDISGIQGKTTRQKPTTVESNIVEIPDELLDIQQDLKMSMDDMTVNSLKFLTAILHDLERSSSGLNWIITVYIFK
jgi:hypothetical protein